MLTQRLNPNALGLSFAVLFGLLMIGIVISGPVGIYPGVLDMMLYWHMFFSMDPAGIVLGVLESAVWGYAAGAIGALFYNLIVSTVRGDKCNKAHDTTSGSAWLYVPLGLTGLLLFVGGMVVQAYWPVLHTSASSSRNGKVPELTKQVTLPYTWQNLGRDLVESGAVDLSRLRRLYRKKDRTLTEGQLDFFKEGSNERIEVRGGNGGNSEFVLNVLWALGITNRNPILEQGRMGRLTASGRAKRLASTGGWPLGEKPGGDLLNSAFIVGLTSRQQQRVKKVASNVYRPCCDNPTTFPDCNHGAAALGLTQLLASQGASVEEIEKALKQVSALWFPRQYRVLATYFQKVHGRDWEDVKPRTVLGKKYSSAGGFKAIQSKLRRKGWLPESSGGEAGCSV